MKTLLKIVGLSFIIGLMTVQVQGQKKLLTILNIDTQGIKLTPQQMGNLVRIEVEKLDSFEVMDRYDVSYLIEKNNLTIDNCFGKICLIEAGTKLGAEKMLSGSVELYGETIIITFRLIDVKTGMIVKTSVMEFLNLQNEIQSMVRIVVNDMFNRKNNPLELDRLTRKYQFDNSVTSPNTNRLNLSGPRLGMTMFSGNIARYLEAPESRGGYGVRPVMFMCGYQFEIQYINQGNFQALFELIPTITGLDQGLVFPSLAILNGLRHNANGIEFALGPTLGVTKQARGYYIGQNWYLEEDWDQPTENPYFIESRVDSRGSYKFYTGFIFAVGKTIKSGNMNIPINAYVIPSKDGIRFGLSFGYNARKDRNIPK